MHFPIAYMQIRYLLRFHKPLHLDNPKTLNEKILYLSLRTDTSLWTDCADKYKVRDYVQRCGLNSILVPLYGVWNDAKDIAFDALPNEFVLKTTHSSGDALLVTDKSLISKEKVVTQFSKELSQRVECAPHYKRIKPRLIAEALLHNDAFSSQWSTSLIDYKVWCFNGIPHFICVYCNRNKDSVDVMTYDLDWNAHTEYAVVTDSFRLGKVIPKPICFEQMLYVSEVLAKPFECVRVDLYCIANKVYFGEMTFTSSGGLMKNFTKQFLRQAGGIIDLSKAKVNK